LADFGKSAGPSPKLPPADLESKSTSRFENLPVSLENSPLGWGGGNGLGRHLETPPQQQQILLFDSFSLVWDILLMQNVPLDAVLLFNLHAAILGWLLTAVQPKLQHPRTQIMSAVS
jgi:hypothetical protein